MPPAGKLCGDPDQASGDWKRPHEPPTCWNQKGNELAVSLPSTVRDSECAGTGPSNNTQISDHGYHGKPEIQKLLLAQLLTRIPETRVMVNSCCVRQAMDSSVADYSLRARGDTK